MSVNPAVPCGPTDAKQGGSLPERGRLLARTSAARLRRWATAALGRTESSPQAALAERVRAALEEWRVAQAHFEEVADPVLVDHAAYWIKEAERKYILLLQQARRREGRLPGQTQRAGQMRGPDERPPAVDVLPAAPDPGSTGCSAAAEAGGDR